MINVAKLYGDSIVPTRKHYNDAGIDLYYYGDNFNLSPGEMRILHTGIAVQIPKGYFGFVADKSRNLFDILGRIVDESYQGEILVKVINTTKDVLGFYKNQPIAQLILIPCLMEKVNEVGFNDLYKMKSDRGTTGGIVSQIGMDL